jgi:hypothetical protein
MQIEESNMLNRVPRRRQLGQAILLCVLMLVSLTGCGSTNKKPSQALVKSGLETTDTAAKYYDSLVQANADYLVLYEYTLIRGGSPLPDPTKKKYEQQNAALKRRAALHRRLHKVYEALGQLIDYNAGGEVKSATDALLTEVGKQTPLPDVPDILGVSFTDIVGRIAKALVEMKQMREFKKNAGKALVVLDGVADIFEGERFVYDQISRRYHLENAGLANYFVDPNGAIDLTQPPGPNNPPLPNPTEQVVITPPFRKYLEPYELEIYQAPLPDAKVRAGTRYWTKLRIARLEEARKQEDAQASRSLSDALYQLKRLTELTLGH